jgi:[glutamine synthetase] adenylyltransferase / [glutamine synthetase]-adenylyl-L-tyrosine phosphorylase
MPRVATARDVLIEFAQRLDPDRARELERQFGQSVGSGVAVALGTVFPQFCPGAEWQREGLAQIEIDGWRVPRSRAVLEEERTELLQSGCNAAEQGQVPDDGQDDQRSQTLVAMRRFAWTERARIALRELLPHTLGGATLLVTMHETSWLAEALLECACQEAREHVARRFGLPRTPVGDASEFFVLGMGKLGGLELNPGSGLDVCFFYDTDEGGSEISQHEHWSRVSQRIAHSVELPTGDGYAWRVDLRLRPEGSQGAICNSLVAGERYYETWGRLWERTALIRARAVAGNLRFGRRFISEVVTPFVYKREVDPSIVHSLSTLLTRSRLELHVDTERDLKLGVGGIREAEFFVQALQLIWGGQERSLRVPGILPAIDRLLGAGLLAEREARSVVEAYTLLRTVEHRIQWHSDIQTHSLPKDERDLDLIARTLELRNAQGLLSEVERARSIVTKAFCGLSEGRAWPSAGHVALFAVLERINSIAEPDVIQGTSEPVGMAQSQLGRVPRASAASLVRATENWEAGVSNELLEHYAVLSQRPDGMLGSLTRERYPQLTNWLLDAVAQSPDPNRAALGLRLVFGRINHPSPYFAALAEDEHAIRRLVTALASSPFIMDTLAGLPDSLDIVMSVGGKVENPLRVVARELRVVAVTRDLDRYERFDAVVTALRRAKSRVFVEVVIADLSGAIELRQARQTLSDLADASLDQAAHQVFGGAPRGLGIVALGKLGAQDLGYGSDLDVIFLYDSALAPDPSDAQAFFIRQAQQIIRLISMAHPAGPGYELDVRLRPSGSQGMLVTSLTAFARYHRVHPDVTGGLRPGVVSSGAAWERQALLRARACAGDIDVATRAVKLAHEAAYTKGPPDVHEMHRLRLRMQRELGREHEGRFDLKAGNGGLLDIEFATQWLQMVHGNDPRVHTNSTEDALLKLQQAGYLSEMHFQVFREGYVFLRQLEQRLFIIHGRGTSAFDMESVEWPQLARRMRLQDPRAPAGELLKTSYLDVTQAIRCSYLAILDVT